MPARRGDQPGREAVVRTINRRRPQQDQQRHGRMVFRVSLLDQSGPLTRAARRRLRTAPLLSPPRSGRLADWRRNTEERTEGPGEQPESESPNPADPSTATALPMRSRIRRPTTPGTSARVPCVPASSAHVQLRDRSRLPSLRGTGGPAQVRHRRGGEGGSRGRPLAGRAPEACQEPPGAAKARARACRRQPWRPLENPGTAKLPDRRGTSPTQAAGMAGGPRPGEESS